MSLISKDDYLNSAKHLSNIIAELSQTLIHLDMLGISKKDLNVKRVIKEMRKAYRALETIVMSI